MSENRPSENDRQQKLADLQARLQKLTAERKAELERSDPLPGSVSRPSAEGREPEPLPVLETPPPMEASPEQPPETMTTPGDPARPSWLSEASAVEAPPPADVPPATEVPPPAEVPRPAEVPPPADMTRPAEPTPPADIAPAARVTSPVQATPAETEIAAETEPAAEAEPAGDAATTQPDRPKTSPLAAALSAASAAMSALVGKVALLAGGVKRAAGGLRRPATAKTPVRTTQPAPQPARSRTLPDEPSSSAEDAEPPARKRRSLRAAILVGLGLIGGIALVLFSDLDLPEALESALPAAETDNAGSEAVDAAANAVSVESGARQAEAGEGAPSKMAPQDAAEPEEGAVEVWTAPPLLEISSPDAADVAGVQVNLDLLEPVASEPTPITSSSALPATGNPTQRPTFIPYDVPPKLENPGEIQRLLERGYPSQLRDAGIEGTVILWIFVDEQGAVQRTEVKESSGYEVMDEAALSTAEKMKFAPAMNRDKATPVWLAQPITFR